MAKHRNLPTCAICHAKIAPPGFALETYDVIGGWRQWYRAGQDGIAGIERVALTNAPGLEVWRGPDVEQGFTMACGQSFTQSSKAAAFCTNEQEILFLGVKLIQSSLKVNEFAPREVVDKLRPILDEAFEIFGDVNEWRIENREPSRVDGL